VNKASPTVPLDVAGAAKITENLDMNSTGRIVNLVNPSSAQDAATRSYVDTATTNMATTSSVSTAITNALGSSGTQENRPTVQRGDTTNATHYLTFIDGSDIAPGDGSSKRGLLRCDGSLVYNPNTNTLSAGTFSGAVSGGKISGAGGYFSGYVGIGTDSPGYPLHVNGMNNPEVGASMLADGSMFRGSNGFAWPFSIRASHGIRVGGDIVWNSDKRIKKNVKDIDGNTALSQIRQIRPKIYNYIDYSTKGNVDVYGFIAQDVKDVISVNTPESEFKICQNIFVHDVNKSIERALDSLKRGAESIRFTIEDETIDLAKLLEKLPLENTPIFFHFNL
jgi:hypothetical protein